MWRAAGGERRRDSLQRPPAPTLLRRRASWRPAPPPLSTMATALSDQLAAASLAWRGRTGGAPAGEPARRKSLLYEPGAAADVDLATVYEVGLSGE